MRQQKFQLGVSLIPCLILISCIALITGFSLIQIINHQRIVFNYLQSIEISRELDADILLILNNMDPKSSIINIEYRRDIPDKDIPGSATIISYITVTHSKFSTHSVFLILRQKVNRILNTFEPLHIIAYYYGASLKV